mgnify:CR=1 FL=1
MLITREQIESRVREMAGDLARDLTGELERDGLGPHDEDRVVLIPIMTGAMIFTADLIRQMPIKLSIGLIAVSSYPGQSVTSKGARLDGELPEELEGRHVVIIDDILDSGRTLSLVRGLIEERRPASVRVVVLLDKAARREVDVKAEYVGFEIPDAFVVGYGLDFDGYYRNHPEIAVLRDDVLPEAK